MSPIKRRMLCVLVIAMIMPYLLIIGMSWLYSVIMYLLGAGAYLSIATLCVVLFGVPWLLYRLFDAFFNALIDIESHNHE